MGVGGGLLLDALIGAGATAGVDALTGQPVTWKGEALGAGLGAAGGALFGGAGGAGGGTTADLASAAGGAESGALSAAGADAATAALPAAATSAVADAALPTIDVTATSLAGAAPAALSAADILSGAAGGLSSADVASMIESSADPTAALTETSVTPGFFASAAGGDPTQFTGGAVPAAGASPDAGAVMGTEDIPGADIIGTDQGGGLLDWLKVPKNALTAGELGLAGLSALKAAQLPGAAKTALGAAGPAVKDAQTAIATGGKGSPLWAAQKSAIDASIDQQIANATAAMQQTLANAGAGDKNSGIVQEQIATIKSQLETQRQMLYDQALQQIVNNAVSELTGANQTLLSVAQMQMNQDRFALQLAATGAQLAARLQQLSG
jgi:hypothetical protein